MDRPQKKIVGERLQSFLRSSSLGRSSKVRKNKGLGRSTNIFLNYGLMRVAVLTQLGKSTAWKNDKAVILLDLNEMVF